MIINYFRTALRSLLKHRAITILNISGLAVGMCGALLIGIFILDEFQYDQHFAHKDRIYRLISTYESYGTVFSSALTDGKLAPDLAHQFAEIETATRLLPEAELFLFFNGNAIKEKMIYTDSAFLDVFNLPIIAGAGGKCLDAPSSVIISESMAVKLFGVDWRQKGVPGATVHIDNRIPFTVTAVFRDLPETTHFRSSSFASVPAGYGDWMSGSGSVYTYILLRENADAGHFVRKIESQEPVIHGGAGHLITRIEAQPLSEIHLSSSLEDENAILGNRKSLHALLTVAILLILISAVNFSNVYIATSLNKLKQAGVRMTLGASGTQLRFQVFVDVLLITVICATTAVLLAIFLLPIFNELTGRNFSVVNLVNKNTGILLAGLIVGMCILAGFYPSIVMSRMSAVNALKGATKSVGMSRWRKGLTVFQFSISAIMIVLSIVAMRQVGLINEKSLGFDKDHTITLANAYMFGSTTEILRMKSDLLAIEGVEQVSITGYTPSQTRWGNQNMTFPGRDPNSKYRQMANWLTVDEAFVNTMGLTLLAGRNFLENHETDKNAIIINRTAVERFSLGERGEGAIGSELSISVDGKTEYKDYTVVGVVEDFDFGSLHEVVKPTIMKLGLHRFEIVLRYAPSYSAHEIIAHAKSVWNSALPAIPFEYSSIKDRFQRLHKADTDTSKVFLVFCVITIVISAVGLVNLVAYSIINRVKEIGIRKVLGASSMSIALLVAHPFVLLVVTSYLLAAPIAWVLASAWLSDFVYKTEISWGVYAFTALMLAVVTGMTLGVQSIKAAMMNPVENLRYE